MSVTFNDFQGQYAAIRGPIDTAVQRVLSSGWYLLGQELKDFEAKLGARLGGAHVVGVANGTEAIALALMALGIGPGAEVIAPALTAYPTITGIKMSGATPVVADVDPATGLLDLASVEAQITPRTRAIVPVHLYGQSCDLAPLLALAASEDIAVVEDCAQAIDATYQGQPVGTHGVIGCFSFYPTKNLGAYGDAGAVVTRDAALAERLRRHRNYGQSDRYRHELPGINSRLDELQAAILAVKLDYLSEWTTRRRAIAAQYRAGLRGVGLLEEKAYGQHVYHLFPVRVAARDGFMAHLTAAGIQTLIHYPLPIAAQPDFAGQKDERFPGAETLAKEVVSLPLRPDMTDEQVTAVIAAVNSWAGV